MKEIKLKNISIGNNKPFVLIAGPCVVESRELIHETAKEIKSITDELNIPSTVDFPKGTATLSIVHFPLVGLGLAKNNT